MGGLSALAACACCRRWWGRRKHLWSGRAAGRDGGRGHGAAAERDGAARLRPAAPTGRAAGCQRQLNAVEDGGLATPSGAEVAEAGGGKDPVAPAASTWAARAALALAGRRAAAVRGVCRAVPGQMHVRSCPTLCPKREAGLLLRELVGSAPAPRLSCCLAASRPPSLPRPCICRRLLLLLQHGRCSRTDRSWPRHFATAAAALAAHRGCSPCSPTGNTAPPPTSRA